MKGRVYQVTDLGRGGKGGYVYIVSRLCVEGKVHLVHEKWNDGEKFHNFVLCDGSCNKTVELDAEAEVAVAGLLSGMVEDVRLFPGLLFPDLLVKYGGTEHT